jgi:hypothetical protein
MCILKFLTVDFADGWKTVGGIVYSAVIRVIREIRGQNSVG